MTTQPLLPVAGHQAARARIIRLLRDRWRRLVLLILLSGTSIAATLSGPMLIGMVIDAVMGGDGQRVVTFAALAYAVLAATGAAFHYLAGITAARVGESALRELRVEVFDHALGVPLDVVDRAGTGEFTSRLTSDVNVLVRAVRESAPNVLFAALELILIVVALLLVDWRLCIVALLAGAPLTVAAGAWYARRAPARYLAERQAHADLASGLLQCYRGRSTLAAYRAGGRYRWSMAQRGRAVLDAGLSTTAARNRLRPAVRLSLGLALIGVIIVGAALVGAGAATVGAVSAIALYIVRLQAPVSTLLEELDAIQQATAASTRLVGIAQIPRHRGTIGARPLARQPLARPEGIDVVLSGVEFGYEPGRPVVQALDLHVQAGERITIVGSSGAGKTTLAKLLAGLHEPWSGEIRIGGHRTHDLGAEEMARLVALVPQEGHIFSRTVADNVRLAAHGVTEEQINEALALVGAGSWAAGLPQGLDTLVGEEGHGLGPPQAQQIGLARLVCADPPVVVMDEATAELDPSAAARTEHHLSAALAGRTVITVAHRLDSATRADRIVVMEAGRVVECGSHEELLARPGHYAALWQQWRSSRASGA
ncbi:ABC transporter ATP-binding protein [Hoyosella sp. G463]|uniref:ABC transporter ATP-binding protein n=1 Tax=Lolliginicoccus lacisalsi TaxID=2742202 RepID=A0A927J9C7_9ACTN|nr:ABC transporter ATP-binding protein [Lolliginicoccus lacisalsi]MBD8505091.1 ABC transporter ATP-binding protein [Lolliginicoccus lacisalsi]